MRGTRTHACSTYICDRPARALATSSVQYSNARGREKDTPSPSVCSSGKFLSSAISSDEGSEQSDDIVNGSNGDSDNSSFKIVRRKHKKAARQQRINSNSDSNDYAMDVDNSRAKPANRRVSTVFKYNSTAKTLAAAPKKTTVIVKTNVASSAKPTPPPKVKPPPPICLRDKSKWNVVSSEHTRIHINYSRDQSTSRGIKIVTNTIENFRKLNSYLIKNNIPIHTFALEEERKIKAVIKGIPIEIETEAVKDNLERQTYPVTAVHRMNRRDGTALGLVLAILERSDQARDIFKKLCNVCGLSGIVAKFCKPFISKANTKYLTRAAGGKASAKPIPVKQWKTPLPRVKLQPTKETNTRFFPPRTLRRAGTAASALGEDITTIMRNGRKMQALAEDLHFNIITPLTPTHYHNNDNYRHDMLDIALMKGIALKLSCIDTLQYLNSDHRPVLMRLGSLTGDYPPPKKTITIGQKVSAALKEIDTPILNSIVNVIFSTDDIDNTIGALIRHIRTVVENSTRVVPAKTDRKELPSDVSELIWAKNAALR
ncbi:hypothetical protein EVAR_19974_1 [Eumeta japonica]|uniref:Uncharacterized protein n=1 Tax=Eumeta variegata TaxID=151549 RepID=A0A4C1VBY5_EUMVA|nr:hypothetical protein EVAR_19974_1 [Eumeta japonica]